MEILDNRIVLKVGSSSLIDENNQVNILYIKELAKQIAALKSFGYEVILVTSGAVAAAKIFIKNADVSTKQALSSIGQAKLMRIYEDAFAPFEIHMAQILLTNDDFKSKKRMLNFSSTIEQLMGLNVVPIINENDALSSKEIRVGDNDTLGALVAVTSYANQYVILSDIDGLYNSNPHKNPQARLVNVVDEINDEILSMAGDSTSTVGTGGMKTKLSAAKITTSAGVKMRVANSNTKKLADKIIKNQTFGTIFLPTSKKINSRAHWIGFHSHPNGRITVDTGAVQAVKQRKSLLAIGILSVFGDFFSGDTVEIMSTDNKVFARGMVNYASSEISLILGKQNSEHNKVLGKKIESTVIHANNIVLI